MNNTTDKTFNTFTEADLEGEDVCSECGEIAGKHLEECKKGFKERLSRSYDLYKNDVYAVSKSANQN